MSPASRAALVFLAGLLAGANLLYFAALRGWVPGIAGRASTSLQSATPSPPAQPQPTGAPAADGTAEAPPEPGSAAWWRRRTASAPTPSQPATSSDSITPAPATPPVLAPPPAQVAGATLLIPVAGVDAKDLHDTFQDARGEGRVHDAIDIMAATGTPVHAVADGRIVRLFESERGGLTIYQFDTTDTWSYYYAHLDAYASGIREDMPVKRGQLIGHVGYSGNASPEAPHLHFAVHRLGPEREWWGGEAVNPYPLLTGRAATH
ncbi:MAG: peptidoglycan DD-metalloendopeptidase family protein [Pseudoxanthomonas suwonensis]|nr:peptidoglycan DD-metalloendopeptidase family protein [Pseudoxanthomonas suwonensis]